MRFGYTTWGMQGLPAEETIPILANIGYDSVEVTVVPGWKDDLDTLTPARRRKIKDLLNDTGLALPALAGHRSMIATDAAEHAENWRRLTGTIDLAVEWATQDGPPIIDTTAGGSPLEWDAVKGRMIDRVGKLCDYASERGVTIGIEPHVNSALNSPDRVLWLLGQIGRKNLGITFDISHFNVQGIPIEKSVETMVPVTVFTHIKDERGVSPNHEFLIPGEGDFDYVRYLRAMDRAGFTGDICVEISLMVQRRPNFDPVATAQQTYDLVSKAFETAGLRRG